MFKGTLIAFVAGWALWFWIEKQPMLLGPLPYPQDGEVLHNFQVAVDLTRQARFKAAFVYIWKAHYLILSVFFGLLLGMLGNTFSRWRSGRRFARLYLPGKNRSDSSPGSAVDSTVNSEEKKHERQ